jgi:hypothetical protein
MRQYRPYFRASSREEWLWWGLGAFLRPPLQRLRDCGRRGGSAIAGAVSETHLITIPEIADDWTGDRASAPMMSLAPSTPAGAAVGALQISRRSQRTACFCSFTCSGIQSAWIAWPTEVKTTRPRP